MSDLPKPSIFLSAPERGAASQIFQDAMAVRTEVFVKEQGVPEENEADGDDLRSIHIVAYGADGSDKIPIGTIRIVPVPAGTHKLKPQATHIKLGRLAISKEYRGLGVGTILVDRAVKFARENATLMVSTEDSALAAGERPAWNGMCLLHVQTSAVGFWTKVGFKVDEGMGEWDEEGIRHKGMWKKFF